MEPSLNPWTFIILLAAAHGLLLSLVLFLHKRGNRTANRVLAILIFVFSLRLMEVVAIWTKYLLELPHLFATTASFKYLYGPLLYFYARFLTGDMSLKKRYFLHLLPFALHVYIHLPLYMAPREFKIDYLTNYILLDNPSVSFSLNRYFIFAILQVPHLLFYTYLTWELLKRYGQTINSPLLTIEKIKLGWLRKLSTGFGCLWGVWFLYTIAILFGTRYYIELDYLVTGSVSFMIYAIGYTTFKQPEIISDGLVFKHSPKYEKSTLTPERAENYSKKLLYIMETEKPFTKSDLKLQDLAHRLSIYPHHLSQVLNERLHQNFYDFINQYRVKEAKRKLADPDKNHATILEIAYDVGFNNKASFNAAFKKHVGLTPSQFKKSQQPSS